MQAGPRFRLQGHSVHRLDAKLNPISSRRVKLPNSARLLAASDDLSVVVAADPEGVHIQGRRSTYLRVPNADSAMLLLSGDLLVTAPVMERTTWQGREQVSRGPHRVLLVDCGTGSVMDEATLDVSDAGVTATRHPTDGSVVLDAGEGQDGSRLFVTTSAAGKLSIVPLLDNVVAAAFDPSGTRLLLTPHPSFENRAQVLGWPSREVMGSISGDDLGLDSMLDVYGCFLGPERVLLSVIEADPVLCTSDLRAVGLLDLADASSGADGVIEGLVGLDDHMFAAQTWRGSTSSACVWQVPIA